MTVLVTGGSRGIGREIVLKFAREGWDCAFTYRSNREAAEQTLAEAKEAGATGRIEAYEMDLRDPDAVEQVCDKVVDEFGDVSAVVNNAGIVRNNAAVLMSNEEWDDVVATNLSGPFYVIRSLLMHFLSNRFGRIINISSIAAKGSSGQINYAASKAGLVGLTKTLAKEYGQKGITANTVVVGYVPTSMTDDGMTEMLKDVWMQYCPMKRIGTATEIAGLVHYLTTEPAGFINGEVIHVAGGLTYAP